MTKKGFFLPLTAFLVPALAFSTPSVSPTDTLKKAEIVVPEVKKDNPMELGLEDLFRPIQSSSSDSPEKEHMLGMKDAYAYLSDALEAQVKNDALLAERFILEGISIMEGMIERDPDLITNKRFTELYRSVMTEHRLFYGIPDSVNAEQGEIFAILEDVFEEEEVPGMYDYKLPEQVSTQKYSVPLTQNERVNRSIIYLTQKRPDVMRAWLERSEVYFPMIEQIFKEEGVPDELKHLAMIESGLVPFARSRAAAVGMWQFIAATGKAYGLEINWWMDERRNPEKATRAAARHLKDLYDYWNDWHLAIAGYNISPRGLKRAIRAAGGQKDYWKAYPYLPRETRNYVPMFIATTLIASNPEQFGFQKPGAPRPQDYKVQYVDGLLALKDLASAAGISLSDLKVLNPELTRWATPPNQKYPLRIPTDKVSTFIAGYDKVPRNNEMGSVSFHTVSRGETLGRIARRYGTTVRSLYEINENLSSLIRPGQRIAVPIPESDGKTIAASRPTNELRKSTSRSSTSSSSSGSGTRLTYTVKKGDTIGHIADWYDVPTWRVRSWNKTSNNIRVGEKLVVYVPTNKANLYRDISSMSFADKQKLRSRSQKEAYLASKDQETLTDGGSYTIRRGDNLNDIAKRFGTSIGELKAANNISGSRIYPGQKLVIPGQEKKIASISGTNESASSSSEAVYHTVRRGDNLNDIAKRYGTTISILRRLNDIRGSRIYPGQKLLVKE